MVGTCFLLDRLTGSVFQSQPSHFLNLGIKLARDMVACMVLMAVGDGNCGLGV
jgi:hypothetical protein